MHGLGTWGQAAEQGVMKGEFGGKGNGAGHPRCPGQDWGGSTYWPPCHVPASKEIATDGVPVHPARGLQGEEISTALPLRTQTPRKQDPSLPDEKPRDWIINGSSAAQG